MREKFGGLGRSPQESFLDNDALYFGNKCGNALSSSTKVSERNGNVVISMFKSKAVVVRGFVIPLLILLYCVEMRHRIRIEDSWGVIKKYLLYGEGCMIFEWAMEIANISLWDYQKYQVDFVRLLKYLAKWIS